MLKPGIYYSPEGDRQYRKIFYIDGVLYYQPGTTRRDGAFGIAHKRDANYIEKVANDRGWKLVSSEPNQSDIEDEE